MVGILDSSPSDWLVESLQRLEGLRTRLGPTRDSVSVIVKGLGPVSFEVSYFPVLSHERAIALVRDLRRRSDKRRLLVATRQLLQPTRELLRKEGISWAERLTGVCHIVGPGLFVDVKAGGISPRPEIPPARARLRDRSGLVAEALLLGRPDQKVQVNKLALEAGVSSPLASRILKRLTSLRLLEVHGAGPHRYWKLTEPGGLLDLWTTEEQQKPMSVTSLYVWTRSPKDLISKIALLCEMRVRWALGGVAAANLFAPTLTVEPEPTIWVDVQMSVEKIAEVLGGEIVAKGSNVYLWQSERNLAIQHAGPWKPDSRSVTEGARVQIVSRPRAYVEAMREGRRATEVAQNLRERILSNAD